MSYELISSGTGGGWRKR